MNKTLKQIIKNTISSWGLVTIQAAIGIVMVPFLIGKLGKDGYGAIAILTAMIGLTEVADLGLRAALNRELSEKVAKSDTIGFRELSSSAFFLYLGISVILATIGALIAPVLCTLFKVGPQYYDTMVLLLWTYAPISIVISFVTPVFTAGLASFMRYDVQNNIALVSQIIVSILLFITLSTLTYNPLIIWCAVGLIGAIVRLIATHIAYKRFCYGGELSKFHFNRQSLSPLFKLGASMYMLQLTGVLAKKVDPLILSRFLGIGSVALYQAGSKLPQMINPIVLSLINQLVPLTTKFHTHNNQQREQQLLILGTKYTLYLGIFFVVGMLLFAHPFCTLWLSTQLGKETYLVATILQAWALISLFNYAAGPQWSIALGKNKIVFSVWLAIVTSVFNVILSIYLVGFTKLGVIGVLVGTVITEIVRRPIAAWYVSSIINLPLRQYFIRAYLPTILFFLLLLSTGYIATSIIILNGWMGLILKGLILTILTAVSFYAFEKTFVLKALTQLKKVKQ